MSRMFSIKLAGSVAVVAAMSVASTASATVVRAWSTADASKHVIERISRGEVKEAFDSALDMTNPADNWFPDKMEGEREAVTRDLVQLGAPVGPVTQVSELPFGQSVLRQYRVTYANGEQHWAVKFRRGSGGWHITELHSRTVLGPAVEVPAGESGATPAPAEPNPVESGAS